LIIVIIVIIVRRGFTSSVAAIIVVGVGTMYLINLILRFINSFQAEFGFSVTHVSKSGMSFSASISPFASEFLQIHFLFQPGMMEC